VEQARAEVDAATDALRIAKDEVLIAETVANRAIAESSKAEAEAQRSDMIAYNVWAGITGYYGDSYYGDSALKFSSATRRGCGCHATSGRE
jgi:hypothetical protein